MKKLFGLDKPRHQQHTNQTLAVTMPSAGGHHAHPKAPSSKRSYSQDRWSLVSEQELSAPHSPSQTSVPLRAGSPYQPVEPPNGSYGVHPSGQQHSPPSSYSPSIASTMKAKKTIGILSALDPHAATDSNNSREELRSPVVEKKEKKSFWERAGVTNGGLSRNGKDKDKEMRGRERERDQDKKPDEELTKMIGYLTATGSEDWTLLLEVCDRASASESNAKEAVRAIRKEFRYGEPSSQLAAARLWAVMLRNSSDTFVIQSTSRKFLETIEDLLSSSHTSPVVKDRLMDVLAAASYASGSEKPDANKEGFRNLWKKVKPVNTPDAGIPFDNENTMFVPAQPLQPSQPTTPLPENHSIPDDSVQVPRPPKLSSRNRIIPPEEDMRRLMEECNVGSANAQFLMDLLKYAKPSDVKKKKTVIQEFRSKCLASHELIYAQIPWATAVAERSRAAELETNGIKEPHVQPTQGPVVTQEEELLGALLSSNEELQEALRVYDELVELASEKKVKERSKKDYRLDRTDSDLGSIYNHSVQDTTESSTTSSRMPTPTSSPHLPPPPIMPAFLASSNNVTPSSDVFNDPPLNEQQYYVPHAHDISPTTVMAHPLSDSHGQSPQLPLNSLNYAPDPQSFDSWHNKVPLHATQSISNEHVTIPLPPTTHLEPSNRSSSSSFLAHQQETNTAHSAQEYYTSSAPSAKALGKRKVTGTDTTENPQFINTSGIYSHNMPPNSDDFDHHLDDHSNNSYATRPRSIHYVYDAAAERAQQFLHQPEPLQNVVH